MFELQLTEPAILYNSIGILSEFIQEATFSINKDGIEMRAMDPANISMVILRILPSAFSKYDLKEEEEITVNVDNLKQALRRAKPSDILNLSLERNRLKITLEGKSKKDFQIPLLEETRKKKDIPSLDFKSKVELEANEFEDYINDAAVVGDALTIEARPETIIFSAGETSSKVRIALEKGKDALIAIDSKEPSKAVYAVDYLKKIAKSSKIANTVTLQFSKDYPVRLDYKALDKGQLSFILAPRIEND